MFASISCQLVELWGQIGKSVLSWLRNHDGIVEPHFSVVARLQDCHSTAYMDGSAALHLSGNCSCQVKRSVGSQVLFRVWTCGHNAVGWVCLHAYLLESLSIVRNW